MTHKTYLFGLFILLLLLFFNFTAVIKAIDFPGDANGDSKIDGADYTVWLNNFGKTTSNGNQDGDFNTDTKVDGIDYIIWLTHYNTNPASEVSNNFTIGIFTDVVTSDDLKKINALDVNTVTLSRIYNFDSNDVEKVNIFLNEAQKNNIKVILEMSTPLKSPITFSVLPDFINAVKNHPALYGYYLMDEPELYDFVNVDNFKKLNNVIKQNDSKHPTITIFSIEFDKAEKYMNIADIEGFDFYPFTTDANDTKDNLIYYYQKNDEFLGLHPQNSITKNYFVVLQAFNDNVRRSPTSDELESFVNNSFAKSPKFSGVLYFAWNNQSISKTLNQLPSLQTIIKNLNGNLLTP